MRRIIPGLALLLALSLPACSKKPAPEPEAQTPEPTQAEEEKSARDKMLTAMKTQRPLAQAEAVKKAVELAEDDPEVVPALLELLPHKGTVAVGRRRSDQVNSVREAAAAALLEIGKPGEDALRAKGIALLRPGLADPSPAVRENTAYTLGLIGPIARPAAADVFKLCTDKTPTVRGAAFDALVRIGYSNPLPMIELLASPDEETRRLAAEAVNRMEEIPPAAAGPLAKVLASDDRTARLSATMALEKLGPRAEPAVAALIEGIQKGYPAQHDKTQLAPDIIEARYFQILVNIGEPAVQPLLKLFSHTNSLVRYFAAQALGAIGPKAKPAADELKKQLNSPDGEVALASAAALTRIGVHTDEAVAVVKRGLSNPMPEAVAFSIGTLMRMGEPGRALVPEALAKLSSDNLLIRGAVFELLGQLEPKDAVKALPDLTKLISDVTPEVRQAAARILTNLGPASAPAAETLGKALTAEKVSTIQEQIVAALAAMGPAAKPAVPGLLALAAQAGTSPETKLLALKTCVTVAPDSSAVAAGLRKMTEDPDEMLRTGVAEDLGRLKPMPPSAVTVLAALAKSDKALRVRLAAVKGLATARPPAKTARPELEEIAGGKLAGMVLWAKVALAGLDGDLTKGEPIVRAGLASPDPSARAAALNALVLVGPPKKEDLPQLIKLLKDRYAPVRSQAAAAVGRYGAGAKEAVTGLTPLLKDRDVDVRLAAVEALGAIGPEAKPAVPQLRKATEDPATQRAAFEALNKIGVRLEEGRKK